MTPPRLRIATRFGSRLPDYLFMFQISVASFQSAPTFSQTTTYLPATCCDCAPLVWKRRSQSLGLRCSRAASHRPLSA